MGAIQIVGSCFSDAGEFLRYLEGVTFNLWRPRFVTVHHTGSPDRALWQRWQTRKPPVTDEQWLRNLAGYYGNEMGWSAGPHFFVTPAHICVLSPPNRRGVHAVSFNASAWGVECVGNFDVEPFAGEVRSRLVHALAAMHVAAGLRPDSFRWNERGLHFHRDDPKTRKTCPGKNVDKATLVADVLDAMEVMAGTGDHPSDVPAGPPLAQVTQNVVRIPDGAGALNVRAAPSGKAPILGKLADGLEVSTVGRTMNGPTLWLELSDGGWVAGRFLIRK